MFNKVGGLSQAKRGPTQPCLAKGGEGYLEICLDEGDGNALHVEGLA